MASVFSNLLRNWLAATIFAVFSLFAATSQSQTPPHPVLQMVQWELQGNASLSIETLRRMAVVILDRVDRAQWPDSVRDKIAAGLNEKQRKDLIESSLNLSELKSVIILPAPLDCLEIPDEAMKKLQSFSEWQMPGAEAEEFKHIVQFQKDGKTYWRWFLHPMANPKLLKGLAIFEKLVGPLTLVRTDFKFHFTASRSLVIFQSSYDDAVSLKVSLPAGGGPFPQKMISLKEYTAWTRHNAYLADVLGGDTVGNLKLLQEPYGVGVEGGSQHEDAFLFRRLGLTKVDGKYLIPAFAVLDEKIGAEIARLNGSNNPGEFWNLFLVRSLAKALAELRARTGAEHTSPHSQNILVELNEFFQPTGRIVLRDADFYIDKKVFLTLNRVVGDSHGLTANSYQGHRFALRHGLAKLPSWLSDADYVKWTVDYFSTYQDHFSTILDLPRQKIFGAGTIIKQDDVHLGPLTTQDHQKGSSCTAYHIVYAEGLSFEQEYLRWLGRQRFQKVKSLPVASHAKPGAKFDSWESLQQSLHSAVSFDILRGRLGPILAETQRMTLPEKRFVVLFLDEEKELLLRLAKQTTSAKVIVEWVQLLFFIDPSYVNDPRSSNYREILARLSAPQELAVFDRLKKTALEVDRLVGVLEDARESELLKTIFELRRHVPSISQVVAYTVAQRLLRTVDAKLRLQLAIELIRMGPQDTSVKALLEKNFERFPADHVEIIRRLLANPAPLQLRCEALLAS